jgi:hypothetical protein
MSKGLVRLAIFETLRINQDRLSVKVLRNYKNYQFVV